MCLYFRNTHTHTHICICVCAYVYFLLTCETLYYSIYEHNIVGVKVISYSTLDPP